MTRSREAARISIIDDDESMREAASNLLRSAGFEARTFASAEELLAAGSLNETACLVLDFRLPGMDGLELQRKLIAEGLPIPVVVITAYDDGRLRRRAMEAGAVEFLQKPFAASALLASVRKALQESAHGPLD